MDEQPKEKDTGVIRDHLANERTYLAWIRTSIGIMAFGFVVEKFSILIEELAYLLGGAAQKSLMLSAFHKSYSSYIGVGFVALGALFSLFALIKFRTTQKQIKERSYHPSSILIAFLTLLVFLFGIFLIFYHTRT
jgi:putative membrane protein